MGRWNGCSIPTPNLRAKIPEFVARGDFGLASGLQAGGRYTRLWLEEPLPVDEVAFDADVYLLLKSKAKELRTQAQASDQSGQPVAVEPEPIASEPEKPSPPARAVKRTLRVSGSIPPEVWNRLGTTLIPKLRSGSALRIGLDCSVELDADHLSTVQAELRQLLQDMQLADSVRIEVD